MATIGSRSLVELLQGQVQDFSQVETADLGGGNGNLPRWEFRWKPGTSGRSWVETARLKVDFFPPFPSENAPSEGWFQVPLLFDEGAFPCPIPAHSPLKPCDWRSAMTSVTHGDVSVVLDPNFWTSQDFTQPDIKSLASMGEEVGVDVRIIVMLRAPWDQVSSAFQRYGVSAVPVLSARPRPASCLASHLSRCRSAF